MLVWVDLLDPTLEEKEGLERLLGIGIPSREEMEEIEISSRLYQENGVAFMTAIVPANTDGDDPEIAPVTFILAASRLVTVRFHEPRAFQTFLARAEKAPTGCDTGEGVLIALLEAIVDRLRMFSSGPRAISTPFPGRSFSVLALRQAELGFPANSRGNRSKR